MAKLRSGREGYTGMSNIKLFESKQIRSLWNEEEEKWYFSIVDVVGVLTESPKPGNYWKVLKHRLGKEGNQLVTICNQLKLQSADGKFYNTDAARVARKELEARTGKKVVTALNAKSALQLKKGKKNK
jgi:hypothetical protein